MDCYQGSCYYVSWAEGQVFSMKDIEFGKLQARNMLKHLWTRPISNASVEFVQGGRSVEVQANRGVGVLIELLKTAFVRFSKVKNIDVLIGNLNTVWIAAVSNEARPCSFDKQIEDKPVMVIDDDCLTDKKFDLMLVAKVKSFDSMPNLGVVLKDEGFENVTIRYVGGFWVSTEFLDSHARDCFQKHEGLDTWFSAVQQWKTDFKVDERVLWIDVEGVPLVAWTNKTFIKIAKRWGDMLFSEDSEDNNL
ncbi:hypothetical protein Tco_0961116 [Tanacetum coccineum]